MAKCKAFTGSVVKGLRVSDRHAHRARDQWYVLWRRPIVACNLSLPDSDAATPSSRSEVWHGADNRTTAAAAAARTKVTDEADVVLETYAR